MERHHTYPERETTCCWVYILSQGNGKLSIRYSLDLTADLSSLASDAHLLLYRNFPTVRDAIAHKLYLENISVETLGILIAAENPRHRDLRKQLRQVTRTTTE